MMKSLTSLQEGGLLLNNVFLCASTVTILLGTLWPLFVEVMTGKDISVGAPYFNLVFTNYNASYFCEWCNNKYKLEKKHCGDLLKSLIKQ